MEAWTEHELKTYAPGAKREYLQALVNGWGEILAAGINTPLRLCEFLAQVTHETGGFTVLAENMNYTPKRICEVWPSRFKTPLDPRVQMCAGNPEKLAEAVYGSRLGNTARGDGFKYRGRGFLQDTGRDCYREYGHIIGIDLEGQPELLERPEISLKVALARWKKMDLNRFADRHYTRAIGNAINRGNPYSSLAPIGHDRRVYWFNKAWVVFGEERMEVPPGMALGAHGVKVESLQIRLRELGYPVGKVDKVFGPATARAVASFKLDHKRRTGQELEPDEIIGQLTETALEHGEAATVSVERATATEKDLVAAGSTEAAAGMQQKAAGTLLVAGSAVEGARQAGGMEALQESLSWVPAAHSFLTPVIDAVRWGFSHAFWIITIVVGVLIWRNGGAVIKARLAAFRNGWNLWR